MTEEENAKTPAVHSVEQVMSQLVSAGTVEAVFGKPVERGDTTIIPCAEVIIVLGLGSGGGPADERGRPLGGGSGGGGSSRGRPIAVIVVSREGVRVEPILDLTKIVLAVLTTGAFMLLWLGRLIRADRGSKEPSFGQLKRANKI